MNSKNLNKYIFILKFMTKPREVNPFELRNFSSDNSNQKVKELSTDCKNIFSFKVKKDEELNKLSEKNEYFSCEINFQSFLNQTEWIVYLQNY